MTIIKFDKILILYKMTNQFKALTMVSMRRSLMFLILLFFCVQMVCAQFNFGAGASYVGRGNEFALQAKAFTGLGEKWGAAVGFDYFLTNGLQFDINGDAHYRMTIGEDFRFNPFGGLNFSKRPTTSNVDIGINLGLFTFIPLEGPLNLYLEPKFTVSSLNSFVISTGVMF